MYLSFRICLVIASLLVAACTPALQVEPATAYTPQPAALDAEQADRYWWQVRFRLKWPEDEAPDFAAHLLIAEQVLLPVLVENQTELPLWRFHRRAGRDRAGNQFSLLFFSDRETAKHIDEEITSAPTTTWLLDNGLLEKVSFAQRSPEELGRLELTSDPEWPIEIQRSWPYFIMGASQTWLMLVQELSQQAPLEGEVDYPALLQHYQSVDSRLNDQWRRNGQHAYLHHLSAVFGYQPLQIRSSQLKTF
ncbi:Uncharacterised protein [Halioglobus japonicus]|nr:Uncharacterised protein [Halioglobus japonicus]